MKNESLEKKRSMSKDQSSHFIKGKKGGIQINIYWGIHKTCWDGRFKVIGNKPFNPI
jgi:hypothetical protein